MRSCGLSADGTRLWGAPARGAPRSRAPECPAQPRHASHASRRPAPATIGPQPKLPSSRRAGGRKTWHACTSLGGQHHVNVAAVEPPPHSTAEPPASEDAQDEVADGEIVSEVADRDSLERIYALSAAEVGVDLASLDSLLEQVEQLGQQASTAASDAMLIPDILSEAKEASAALNTRARPASTKPKTTSTRARPLTAQQEIKLARERSVKPQAPRRNTRTGAGAAASLPSPSPTAESPDTPSTSGRGVSNVRRARTSAWGRAVTVQQSSERQARAQRVSASIANPVAEFMRDVDSKLLTFEEEQAIAGRAARYCKVAAKQEALRSRLRRTPTVPELAAHLGTEDVESIEQLLDTGKDCKDLMMHANTRLVVSIAKAANRTREVNLTDLIDEGMTGLSSAVERFEPERGLKFSTYATWWVRQAVLRAHARLSTTVYVPSSTKQQATRLAHFRGVFMREHGRFPTLQEISKACGVSETRATQLLNTRLASVSLQASANGAGQDGGELHETIADQSDVHCEAEQHHTDAMRSLEAAIGELPERERRALRLRNGLDTVREDAALEGETVVTASGLVPLAIVARELCVSKERARQLEKRALAMLRRRGTKGLRDALALRSAAAGGEDVRGTAAVNRRS